MEEAGPAEMKTDSVVVKSGSLVSIVLNLLFLAIVGIVVAVLNFGPDITFRRGFYCSDDSIKYPYHENTVSFSSVVVIGFGVPILSIVCIELKHYLSDKREARRNGRVIAKYRVKPFARHLPPIVYSLGFHLVTFLTGIAATQLLTDVAKVSIGRLRPHFLDVCRPDYDLFNCTTKDGLAVYITDYTCTGTDHSKLEDSRLSFFSGHASTSFYFAVYFCLYLQSRMTWPTLPSLLRPLLQLGAVTLALYCSLSRVSDYKHHWGDVLVGSLAGALIAIITAICVGNLFDYHQERKVIPQNNLIAMTMTDDLSELKRIDNPDST